MTKHDHAFVIPRDNRCTECNGRGWFCEDNGPAPREYDCEECDGTGEIEDDYMSYIDEDLRPTLLKMRAENEACLQSLRARASQPTEGSE